MYCPQCGSEYREGFTTCADCQIPLVERLPPEWTPPARRERSNPLQGVGARWSALPAFARLLIVWFLVFCVVQIFTTLKDVRDLQRLQAEMYQYGNPAYFRTGILLRGLFLSLLPLVCAMGILRQARWARAACLVYLPIAALYEVVIMHYLWRFYTEAQNLFTRAPTLVLPYLAGHLIVIIVDGVLFFRVQQRGFGGLRQPAHSLSSS
jgi:hypothetical protein